MKPRLPILILVLTLLISACNLPTGQPQNEDGLLSTQVAQTLTSLANQNPSPSELATQLAAPLPANATASATQSPAPGAPTSTSLPCNLASFVSDITIPDNTNIKVNEGFTKTWKLKNVGSCTWTSGYQLVFDSGDQMSGPGSQQLTNGTVASGQTIDVSVNLVAPGSAGTYKGNWKLREPGGAVFGLSTGPFWVQIKATAVANNNPDWPTFNSGDTGNEVFAIQYLLLARGYNLNPDGIWGPITQSNVENFQTDKNLIEDGFVGPETWQALIIQVSQGQTGPAIRAVQKLLRDKYGYNTVNVDGIFGPITANAVKDFQGDNGLAVDGIVGPNTWQKLINN